MLPEEEAFLSFDTIYYNYARFHSHPVNKLLHILFIPVITWTLGVFSATTAIIDVPHLGPLSPLPFLGALLLGTIYLYIRPSAGLIWLIWSLPAAYLCTLAVRYQEIEVW
jgi:uncharacterized membrane protein YGL010W